MPIGVRIGHAYSCRTAMADVRMVITENHVDDTVKDVFWKTRGDKFEIGRRTSYNTYGRMSTRCVLDRVCGAGIITRFRLLALSRLSKTLRRAARIPR